MTPAERKAYVLGGESGQDRAYRLMQILRSPEGCAWDNKQTHTTLRKYLIEESYELADCLTDSPDDEDLREELGDVYLQVLFHSRIAEQEQRFTMHDVADTLVAKMIDRHPHVFADEVADSAEAVLQNWEKSKQERKPATFGEGLPQSMPALTRAQTLSSRAASLGFDWPSIAEVRSKLDEEIIEADNATSAEHLAEEIGDILFTVVNWARKANLDAEDLLQSASVKFQKRFQHVLSSREKNATLDQMEELWQQAKMVVDE